MVDECDPARAGVVRDFLRRADAAYSPGVDLHEADAAEEAAERILRGNFGMDDLLKQLRMIQRLGPLRDVMAKMPGFGKVAEHVDEGEIGKVEAMIQSMTQVERLDPQ